MLKKVSEKLYARAPVPLQNAMVTAYGAYWNRLRFGGNYRDHVRTFAALETNSLQDWESLTHPRIAELLHIAAREVPYYRETWTAGQIESARQGSLLGLPLLEKDPIRRNPISFVREGDRSRRELVFQTSGSTGTPIASHFTVDEYRAGRAIREARSNRWAGVSFDMPRATFSGRLVEPDPESKGPYYRYNAVEKQVYFSAFHVRKDTAKDYVEALHRHGTRWLTGYAVSFYLLGQFMLELNLSPPSLDSIITTSEKVTPEMRETMEAAFGCRVFEEYSTVENALFASECEKGSLHVSPDAGVIEILRPDGTPCDAEEAGEVVTTSLLRKHQPLIRFRLGDIAAWAGAQCSCGRAMPILREVVGRVEDVVVGPDGRKMVRFHGVFVGLPSVRCGQIIQEDADCIRVLIETTADTNEDLEGEIAKRVKERLGGGVDVVVERVEEIPRGPGGKFKAVISKMSDRNQRRSDSP